MQSERHLRSGLKKLDKKHAKEYKKLEERKASSQDFQELDYEHHVATVDFENGIEYVRGQPLIKKAKALDIGLPAYTDETMWALHEDGGSRWLTQKGRDYLRDRIHEHETRKREARSWLEKIVVPIVTALIGVGALGWLYAHFYKK